MSGRVLVLMYHSISGFRGPTFIAPDLFAAQLAAIGDAGYRVARLSELAAWRAGETELPERTVVLTFDDALDDFVDSAAPAIASHGWSATVFAPTKWVGRKSGWRGAEPSQQVLDWPALRSLAAAGFDIGSHAETHTDLTTLDPAAARSEIVGSKSRLEQELQAPVTSFAAPYGATNAAVRAEIARCYDVAAGVRLGRAERTSDIHDLPRVEMHYFRDLGRWRDFLAGRADAYFALRQTARSVREGLTRATRAVSAPAH